MLRPAIHLALHLCVPAIVARVGFADRWKWAWLVMMGTMLVDLDHLLATPVFDPDRCSIGFHPLHTWPAIFMFAVLTAIPKTRLIGLGLVIHMVLDILDCWWMGWVAG
jgi:hypothetical protein